MQQIQIAYKNSQDFIDQLLRLKSFYDDNYGETLEQILFYINWSGDIKRKLDSVVDMIEEFFPNAIYFGNEGSGNIAAGEFFVGINVTCFIFESKRTKAELVWVEKGTKVPSLNALWNLCKTKKNLKAVELLPTISYTEMLKIDKDVPTISNDVLIFGGTACQIELPAYTADIVAKGHKRTSDGMIAILYSGEDLFFSSEYAIGWQGIGKLLTITKAHDFYIDELDNQTPRSIYEKYFGSSLNEQEIYVFPLLVYEDGVEYLRTSYETLDDGTMKMFVDLKEGTKCRLSYGDRNSIIDSIYQKGLKVSKFRPEGILSFSCAARRLFWGDNNVSKETKFLDSIAPTCGFYTGGEILRFGNKLRILNQTLSLVSIREFNGKDIKPVQVDLQESDKTMISRLAYFTRKVTQEQEEALKIAEAASRAKTEFLFNMSHDIRTPLNAIIGFANIASREINNKEKALDSINKVCTSSDILLSIINDILDMSRIESGKVKMKFENIEIRSIFNKIEPVMKNLALQQDIKIKFEIENLVHDYVYADVGFVERVLINIISNAIKYTHKGGYVNISLKEIESKKDGYGMYEYTVEDNGIGMSEEFQKHMFEEFSREENSTTSGIQGTGLGLSLALKLVQLMNGKIICHSKENVGSTFIITLPFKIINKEELDSAAFNNRSTFNFRDKKVLVVEDNVLNLEIMLDILHENGCITEFVTNGALAVDKLVERGPNFYDFILMDIQMPVMNGYEATKKIREMYPTDDVKIIAVSANAFAEDKAASIAAGMNDHVAKPININELKMVMAKHL